MADHYASGRWHVTEGSEELFVERWEEFLSWTRETQPALEQASLIRSTEDPRLFLSFAAWKDPGARNAWKQSEGFAKRFSACRELCDEFMGGDFEQEVRI